MKFFRKHRILSVLFVCLLSSSMKAQIGSFRNVNNGEGLLDWQISCFFKDAEGFLWTGGPFLVQRFDGRYIKTYNLPKGVNKVFAINETSDGVIYVATSNGLYTIPRNSSILNRVYSTQITKNVFSILIDTKGSLYVGTQDGFTIISQNNLKTIQTQNATFPFNQILSIHQTADGVLWLLTPGGIASYNPTSERVRTYSCISATDQTYFTCMTGAGSTLYMGTEGSGIYSFNTQDKDTKAFMKVGDGSITCMSSDGKSELYVGTAGTGVYFLSIPQKKVLRSFDSSPKSRERLTSSMVTSILVDNLGILWVGSSEQLGFDFMFLKPKAFVLYKTTAFTTNNLAIHQFYIGEDFKLLSNRYGIYYVSEKNGIAQFFETGIGKAKCLRSGDVLSFIPYNKEIILGGEGGIYSFDPASVRLKVFDPMAFINKSTVYHLTTDGQGDLWVASSNGVHILDKKTMHVRSFTTQNSHLLDDVVRFVYFDRKGRTWICTNKGICFWDDTLQDFRTGNFPKEFINEEQVHFMMEDRKGNILFCYNLNKAFFTDPTLKDFRTVCTLEDADFTGNWINKILQDTSGIFWFIGSRGTIKADEGLTNYRLFSTTEGLMEPYATDGCFDKKGQLWLSNNKGLYYSSSSPGSIKRTIAPMALTDVQINGVSEMNEMNEAIDKGTLIKLRKNKNNIEFQFALLTYDKPDLMVYECQLKGYSTSWHILRGLNSISYKDLKPGRYTFVVRHNMDHTCFKEVHFTIRPLFSTLEILLILILAMTSGGFYYRYNRTKMQKKSEASQKTREAEVETGQKYRFNKISEEEANAIISKLRICMDEKRLYLNDELKMPDLAKEVGCSNQTLSQVFNAFMNETYYDFVNRYRIEEFKHIIATTDYSKLTLKSNAKKSGFNSYASFFRAFKEQTGITPNEFIQNFESQKS